ncbi:putative RNA helicase [Ascosphaera pollenicola]|nr:putative RNA helicase [Ascosphaera pollenicola]
MSKSSFKEREDSVSDVSDNESVASSSPSGDEGSDNSDSNEETLAHQNRPLKRRRPSEFSLLLPDDDEEEDEDELPPAPARPLVQTASRIKKKVDTQQSTQEQTTEPEPVTITEALNAGVNSGNYSSTFASLGLSPWLVKSLSNMAITRPTAIQKACIPEILKGKDCIGGSRTGSGKTVAFATPILQRWAEDPFGIYAVVLTPTRELALQIFEQFKAISAPQSLKPLLITGGTDIEKQAIALAQRPHVVIATPGRLADHIKNSGDDTIYGLRRVKAVVLDEADRLLASGPGSMLEDVGTCLSALPPSTERQTLLFTATVTPEVRSLKDAPRDKGKQPVFMTEISTENQENIPSTLRQTYLQVPMTHKEAFLHVLLSTENNISRPAIIFCNRTKSADLIERILRRLGHRATSLHSRLPQSERINNLARFRAAAARILVATDVASRGLDIPIVSLVVNFDVPRNPDDYVHRVGRTARAGRSGEAVTLVGQRDVALVLAIEKRVGRQMLAWEEEGVNIESRVVKGTTLKEVGEAKREAMGEIEEGRDVLGRRLNKMKKIR